MKTLRTPSEPIVDPMALEGLGTGDEITVEGDETAAPSAPAPEAPKRRGRRPKAATTQAAGPNPKGIEATLQLVHGLLAMWVEEMAISQPEAEQLGQAIANVARHYPNFVASQKTMDIITLAACAGMIYLPRLKLASDRIKARKAAPVTQLHPVA